MTGILTKQVEHFLKCKTATRECSYNLYYWILIEFYKTNLNNITAFDFIMGMKNKLYPDIRDVDRTKRKVMEKHPYLRCKNWESTHKKQSSKYHILRTKPSVILSGADSYRHEGRKAKPQVPRTNPKNIIPNKKDIKIIHARK